MVILFSYLMLQCSGYYNADNFAFMLLVIVKLLMPEVENISFSKEEEKQNPSQGGHYDCKVKIFIRMLRQLKTKNWVLRRLISIHVFLTEADDCTGVLLEHFSIDFFLYNCIIQKYRLKLLSLLKNIPTQNVYFSG